MNSLINDLIKKGFLKDEKIIEAFSDIDRAEFLPENFYKESLSDVALPIGYGQAISQPSVVALMLSLLDAREGQKVLDIGSGSGWTVALLCHIVGRNGYVGAIERIEKLLEWGKKNVDKYGYVKDGKEGQAEFFLADGSKGLSKRAPFDRILVSAFSDFIPPVLKEQLKIGGKMVIPIKNNLWFLEKKDSDKFEQKIYPGFSFVPLIKD
ncbi:MAG: protein-L-isoaspartate O-methyltransferase [Candidatus Moranbacteria bacterium CG_4_8_14_3_um_filter_34_16]|nr:MAG: protein-L-isoaspartate O-methyltransferase [Candidatus Moranbacteria bacterium CG08_land_8_20_14_0_20_34_16]PIW95006.1 MAG: protein-L-isoaspartate O-methyltransferase [Candidatus Moranbacteria bacterium CG_4_8_14_3_um_filter_34_16]